MQAYISNQLRLRNWLVVVKKVLRPYSCLCHGTCGQKVEWLFKPCLSFILKPFLKKSDVDSSISMAQLLTRGISFRFLQGPYFKYDCNLGGGGFVSDAMLFSNNDILQSEGEGVKTAKNAIILNVWPLVENIVLENCNNNLDFFSEYS